MIRACLKAWHLGRDPFQIDLTSTYPALSLRQQHFSKPKSSEGQSVALCVLLISITEGLSFKVVANMCMRFKLWSSAVDTFTVICSC